MRYGGSSPIAVSMNAVAEAKNPIDLSVEAAQ